jgi:hypothetical protein
MNKDILYLLEWEEAEGTDHGPCFAVTMAARPNAASTNQVFAITNNKRGRFEQG